MPSLPTTAISADAPSSMTYSKRNDGRGGEIDVSQWGAGFIEDVTEPHRYQFQLGDDAVVVACRQGVEQMILMGTRVFRCSEVSSVLHA